jgi:hypothetical protein
MGNTTTAPTAEAPISQTFVVRATHVGIRRPLRRAERALVMLEAFVSLCGLAGGAYMASHERTVMSLRYLQGTWFHTWRWPGIALLFFVGVCPTLVAVATVRRFPVATVGHIGVGVGLVAWIVLEAAWMVVSPPLQIFVSALGVAILVLGLRELREGGHPESGRGAGVGTSG